MKKISLFAMLAMLCSLAWGSVGGGTISTAEAVSSPTLVSQLTAGAYVSVPVDSTGVAALQIVLQGSPTLSSNLQVYFSSDGVLLERVQDSLIQKVSSGVYGAIAGNASGTYMVNVAYGTAYVLEPNGGTGSATLKLITGPGAPYLPGSLNPAGGSGSGGGGGSVTPGTGWASSGLATQSTLASILTDIATLLTNIGTMSYDGSGYLQTNVKTSALPTGAATSALQTTGNTLLGGGLPAALDANGYFKTHEQGTASVSISGTPTVNVNGADSTASISISALNGAATVTQSGYYGAGCLLSGTWVGTVVAEWSADGGTTWSQTYFVNLATNAPSLTETGTGTYSIMVPGGAGSVRVRCSAYTSGTITGTLRATIAQLNNYSMETDGSNIANIAAFGSSQNARYVAPSFSSSSWSATTTGVPTGGTITANGIRDAVMQITSIGTSVTATAQYSTDGGTTWYTVYTYPATAPTTAPAASQTATGSYRFMPIPPCSAVRVNLTAESGTITGTIAASTANSNPTALNYTTLTGTNTVTIGAGSAAMGSLTAGTAVIGQVYPSVQTGSGLTTIYQNAAISNTATSVKGSAGNLYGYNFYNPNATAVTLELFNTSSVTLGSTTPFWHMTIAAGASGHMALPVPISFSTAIYVAAVTAYNGSTAPSTGVDISIIYN